MNSALLFAFNLDEPALRLLGEICAVHAVQLRSVPKAAHAMPLGTLLGMPAASLSEVPEAHGFDDPMLVMCGFEEAQFNAFLRALRDSQIPRIDLKAVLTPSNIGWTAVELHHELRREHDRLHFRASKE